jgi:dienelactone hydrolase
MPSLIPGFEYDIFISYRQKDNKYDGWVTEFVDRLNRELESTFKEDISVYFDINPHDGLLETYDVDASLEDKLSCLIFIPIVSRTYCDPKSFAWDHEFKAFVNQASQDRFGLKIKLPNGNVANRVLPVRIHELDAEDIKLCESVIGGFLRGVDFIYKSSGVNRPLRAHEDHPYDNQNKTYYRDQINKVANAIDEIIIGLKKAQHKPKEELIVSAPVEKTKVEIREREPEIPKDKKKVKYSHDKQLERILNLKKNPWYYWIAALFILLAILSGAWYIHHKIKIKWALTKALPEIQRCLNELNMESAFSWFQKAEKYIPENPEFRKLALGAMRKVTILTNPPGADIYIRKYSDAAGKWKKFGITPLDSMEMPNFMFYLIKIEKPGYEDVVAVLPTQMDTLYRTLFKKGSIPQDMVFVEGFKEEMAGSYLKRKNGFFMDRYEVTNKEFKEFVDNGGYRDSRYWSNKFIKDGKVLTFKEAMAEFTDQSGRPGPATWEAGDFPEGQDDYPVTGISWYEAAAFALFAGKDLPTLDHWYSGAGFYYSSFRDFGSRLYPLSNFKRKGPEAVGKNKGINSFGASDMAGNVREWCWNETQNGHIICGGGWDDANYMYDMWSQVPTFDRSAKNGVRCVKYPDKGKIPENIFQKIEYSGLRDYSKEKPLPENVFRIYKNQFLYDDKPLDAIIEQRDESPPDWIIEKVTFNAAYENERVISYLFLPKNSAPPFQTILFFPGSYAISEKDLVNSASTDWFNDYLIKSGRAVMFPVYKGTYERMDEPIVWEGHQYTEWLIKGVKDFSRSIDYLETRTDIDTAKLGFYGHSWGGEIGGIIPAIENRLAITILINGGFDSWRDKNYPEADEINYVAQIRMPVLMLNGKYDRVFPYEITVKPFFNLLGTAAKDKRLVVYETDHYVPKREMIKEVLNWLDKYFGPVNYLKGK